jgi:uncharacterized membrane protein
MAAHNQAPKHAKDIFTQPGLDRLAVAIAEVEKGTSCEVRIAIREERDSHEAALPIEDIAKGEFLNLGMDKTAGRNSILLFILFEERKFYIYGDEGIHTRVDPNTWEDVAATLKENFKHGEYEQGIQDALLKILSHVRTQFVPSDENPNELSNEVIIG